MHESGEDKESEVEVPAEERLDTGSVYGDSSHHSSSSEGSTSDEDEEIDDEDIDIRTGKKRKKAHALMKSIKRNMRKNLDTSKKSKRFVTHRVHTHHSPHHTAIPWRSTVSTCTTGALRAIKPKGKSE